MPELRPPLRPDRPTTGWPGPLAATAAVLAAAAFAPAPAGAQEVAAAAEREQPAETRRNWEAALGVSYRVQPDGNVRGQHELRLSPVVYLRWGRISLTNARGVVGRRSDDVIRGVGAELVRSDRWRLNMNLRYESGRRDDGNNVSGVEKVPATLRVRLSARYNLGGPWRLGANWSVDALGRGTGQFGALNGGWERRLDPATTFGLGASVTVADPTWMRLNYGVSDAQAAASGVPRYQPSGGLRDVGASASLRRELSYDWVGFMGLSVSRLMAEPAASPLALRRDSWAANIGIARRF